MPIRFISLSKMTCKVTTKFSIMQTNDQKLCSFTQKGTRLQLVQVNILDGINSRAHYQVRLNRKIVSNTISEYVARKVFASYCQNIVLQLKIY